MSGFVDEPASIREGEEIDALKLMRYLEGRIEGVHGSLVVEQFAKGYSNLTYLIRVGEREYVLRRPPGGVKIKSAHDMGREYRILTKLTSVWKKVPKPILFCDDESVVGAPFYIMERVRGVILRSRVREGAELRPERMRRISEMMIDTLTEIHAIDWAAIGLEDLGHPQGYVERQIKGWTQRYAKSQTDVIPGMDAASAWLEAKRPPESGATLVHNDFKYDNVVIDPASFASIVAVLDWEMATIGDPLMDLGTAIGYWVDPGDPPEFKAMRFGPTHLPGNLTRRELVDRYAERTGRDVTNIHYYYVFALYKLGVVAQQLYRRFKEGLTSEARYGAMLGAVKGVAHSAQLAIEKGRIDRL